MGDRTDISTTAEGKLRIIMLSKTRVVWFVSVQLARLVIACLLGYGAVCFTSKHMCMHEYAQADPSFW